MISWKEAVSNLPKRFCMVGTRYFESTENIRVFGGFLRARAFFSEKNDSDRGVFPVFGKTLFRVETVRVRGLWGLVRDRVGVFAQITL